MRFFDLGGGFQALLIEYPRIHPRQHIAFIDELPLFDQNRLDTPGNFGGDIDFRRLDAAITGGEARREPGRAMTPAATTIYPVQRRLFLSIRDSLCSILLSGARFAISPGGTIKKGR